jgi:recombination protein RecT
MRFLALNTLRKNQALLSCSVDSFLGSLFTAAQMGLEIGVGALNESWIIPYAGEATFQIGYMGWPKLMTNTGLYSEIVCDKVFPGDELKYEKGSQTYFKHVMQSSRPIGLEPIEYYAYFKTIHGGFDFKIWPRAHIIEHARQHSKAYRSGSGPWFEHFDAMALKTVLKDLCKRAPKGTEQTIGRAIAVDQSIIKISDRQTDPTTIDMEHSHEMPAEKNERGETQTQETLRKEKEAKAEAERLAKVSEVQARIKQLYFSHKIKRAEFEEALGVKLEMIKDLDIEALQACLEVLVV